jgi:hypothetical protein
MVDYLLQKFPPVFGEADILFLLSEAFLDFS